MKYAVSVVLGVALASVLQRAPAAAQSPELLTNLLITVQRIGADVDMLANVLPRVQIVSERLGAQEQRLQRATMDHGRLRDMLDRTTEALAGNDSALKRIEDKLSIESNPKAREELEHELAALKAAIDRQSGEATQLRNREAEAAAALNTEQLRWTELNQRLDEIERLLDQRVKR